MDARLGFNFIQKMEVAGQLWKMEYQGWKIWPLLRYPFYVWLTTGTMVDLSRQDPTESDMSRKFRVGQVGGKVWMELGKLVKGFKKETLPSFAVFTSPHNRREMIDNKLKDVIFDDLYEPLKEKAVPLVVEMEEGRFHAENPWGPRHITGELFSLWNLWAKMPPDLAEMGELVKGTLKEHLKNSGYMQDALRMAEVDFSPYLFLWWQTHTAVTKLLKMFNFKFIMVNKGFKNQGIISAGKGMGLPVIETQPGMIDEYHPGYIWSEEWHKDSLKMPIASYLMLWGDYWLPTVIQKGKWSPDKALPAGCLRMEYWRKRLQLDQGKNESEYMLITTKEESSRELAGFIRECADMIKNEKIPLKIIVKVHPKDSQNYEWAWDYRDFMEVIRDEYKINLYELIGRSRLHAGVNTACHIEAIGLDTPTAVIKLKNWERMTPFIDNKWVLTASKPQELVQIARRIGEQKGYLDRMATVRNKLWTPNAQEIYAKFLSTFK